MIPLCCGTTTADPRWERYRADLRALALVYCQYSAVVKSQLSRTDGLEGNMSVAQNRATQPATVPMATTLLFRKTPLEIGVLVSRNRARRRAQDGRRRKFRCQRGDS
jgi:hypothetical protein